MKNYLVFDIDTYMPLGGMHDLIGDYETIEEATKALEKIFNGHIYSLKDKKIIIEKEPKR